MRDLSRRDLAKALAAAPALALAAPGHADAAAPPWRGWQPWSGWQQVPGGMTTYSAPGVTTYFEPSGAGNFLYLFVRGTDNLVYFNRTDGTTWSGWQQVPGGGRTSDAPAPLGTGFLSPNGGYSEYLGVSVRGTDNDDQIYLDNFVGTGWSGWGRVPGGGLTPSAPALAYFNSPYLIVRGLDNDIYYDIFDPFAQSWGGWRQVPFGWVTYDAPSAAAFSPPVYALRVFVRSADDRIYTNVLDDSPQTHDWSGWNELPGGGLTPSAPAAFDGGVFVRGTDDGIYLNTLSPTGAGWSGWSPVPGGGLTPSAPAAVFYAPYYPVGFVYVFVRGLDNLVYFNRYRPLPWRVRRPPGAPRSGPIRPR